VNISQCLHLLFPLNKLFSFYIRVKKLVILNDAPLIANLVPIIFCILLMKNLYNCPSEIRSKVSNTQLASEFASFEQFSGILYNLLIIKH